MQNNVREYIPTDSSYMIGAEPDRKWLCKSKVKYYPIIRHNRLRNGVELSEFKKVHKLNNQLRDLYGRLKSTPKSETEDREETFRLIKRTRDNLIAKVKTQEQKYKEDLVIKQRALLEPVSKKPRKNKRNGSYECAKPAGIVESQWERVIAGRAAFMKAHGELLDQEEA